MGIDEIVKNMYELSDNDEDEDMATRFLKQNCVFHNFLSLPFPGNPYLRHSVGSNPSLARHEREL